ncbi:MAG: hypothetical protein KF830_13300 [Planctomycetes bacterium]|nr:hypothetical protein [Planctomycetota bacterium]
MRTTTFAILLLAAAPVLAQSNAVPGLDIQMYEVTDLGYYGRRGAAYPNGEAGFMVGHSWCNSGTVNLPWQSQVGGVMVDQYPRIAFLLARESGGRMVQVSGFSFAKYSPTAYNFSSGPCAPCNSGGGSFFYVGCSDTYGSGTNASQINLGPTDEINPWLGTWNPQGSYFDRGDPAVSGPAATDSVRSLTFTQVSAFDSVKNRMIVQEPELLAGATYYGQVQAVVQGEPVGNRGNNLMHRQASITGTGSSWAPAMTGPSALGSVLTRWTGATWSEAGNGGDDGRFLVAVKVTGPVGGLYHYEYAIHNIDNHRGAASFRVPLAPGAIVQNAGFRDIDANPLNDWTVSLSATELAFLATANNRQQWNTIYNCWFDCSIPPGAGSMTLDQALPGPGALAVQVPTTVPSNLAFANRTPVGAPCGQCTGTAYQLFPNSGQFDLNGGSMTLTLDNGAYTVTGAPVAFVPAAGTNLGLGLSQQTNVTLPFPLPYPGGSTTQLQVCSPGYVSPGTPNPMQLAPSALLLLQGQPRWAVAWSLFAPNAASAANVWYDASPTRAILTWNNVPFIAGPGTSTFQIQLFPNGTVHLVWPSIASSSFATMVGWSPGGNGTDPGSTDLSVALSSPQQLCAAPFDGLSLDLSANPVIGTTYQWRIAGIPANTGWGALLWSLQRAVPPVDLTGLGMPGCYAHLLAPETVLFASPGSTQQVPQTIPNATSLVGLEVVGQAVTYNPPLTPFGLVASNGLVLLLGL